MSQVKIDKFNGHSQVSESALEHNDAGASAGKAAEFAAALDKHRQEIRTTAAGTTQPEHTASVTSSSRGDTTDTFVDSIRSMDAEYKSRHERIMKNLVEAGESGDAVSVMKYTFELNQLENQAQLCIKTSKQVAGAVDQLVKTQ